MQDDDTGAHPDGASHSYCFGQSVEQNPGIQPNIVVAEREALHYDTDAVVVRNETCDVTGTSETDVVWRLVNLTGATGATPCVNYHGGNPNGICDQYNANLDLAEINAGDEDEIDQTQTACHELGHSVGLTHGGQSADCMINSGATPPTALQFRRYGPTHHIPDHINDWF